MTASRFVIGIDLGTTNSALAYVDTGRGEDSALETLNNARRGRYRHMHLTARPGAAKPPIVKLVDIRGIPLDDGISAPASRPLASTCARREPDRQAAPA